MMAAARAPRYVILEAPEDHPEGFHPYGGCREMWECREEAIIAGPAETGKTRVCLEKLDALMWKYPGAQAIIVRKTYKSLKATVLQTFERKVLRPGTPVEPYGGEKALWYDYPNGSRIFLGGMDSPDRILSSEWDVIYVNQAEELTVNDWEVLTTRATGRAGNMPYSLVLGDCNPSFPRHWIRLRADAGKFRLIESRHEDNPTLFDPTTGLITEQGRRTLSILDNLTGVRYRRLRKGQWAAAEGAVYEEFDRALHLIDPFEIPPEWPRIRAIDFGYTNPFVCHWWALDGDGRMYLYREIYMSHRIVGGDPQGNDHARLIRELSQGERIIATVADHDAEDCATLEAHGIPTERAMKAISPGIQAVQRRLRVAGDGRPRLFIFRDALVEVDPLLQENRKPINTEQEYDSYIWRPDRADGTSSREAPLDKDDHGMDTTRYAVAFVDDVRAGEEAHYETVVYDERYEISPI